MSDNLKSFIQQHRQQFDQAEPPESLWQSIERKLPAEIEGFIRTHRNAFDAAEAPEMLWTRIQGRLPAAVRKPATKTFSLIALRPVLRAAAVIALLVTGIGFGYWFGMQQAQKPAGMAMSEVSEEYAELEDFYRRDIAGKQEELVRLAGNRDDEVLSDLRQMDQAMVELRKELADVPPGNREQVVRAMIENYKAKLAILQRVLEHLQPSSDSKNIGKNETESI